MVSGNPSHSFDNAVANDRCPQCSACAVVTSWHHDVFTYGSGDSAATISVEIPVRHCQSCGFEFLDQEAESLRHKAVCRHLGVLSPTEVRGIRAEYGMTRAMFAQATGLGEATLNRWENGVLVQNLANDRYLRLLAIPGIMRQLTQMLRSDSKPSQARDVDGHERFRVLRVSDQHRRARDNFHLRLAS